MSNSRNRFSPAFRDSTVREVAEYRGDYPPEWEAMMSIAGKVGFTTVTLHRWYRDEPRIFHGLEEEEK